MAEGAEEEGRPTQAGDALSRRAVVTSITATGVLAQANASGQSARPSTSAQMGGGDAASLAYRLEGDATRGRSVAAKLAERVSVLDFDVDPTGSNDSSAGFREAFRQTGAGELFVPRGRYLIGNLPVLGTAGRRIVGESRWATVLTTESGGGPILASEVARQSTSAFHMIGDLMIDLNGQDVTAIDLASINASVIQRIHVRGGSGPGVRRGTGLRFAAPLRKGAYDNAAYDCSFEYLDRAVAWDTRANNNAVYNCRALHCRIAFDAAPENGVDTPRIFGGRAEKCDVGLLEGASFGGYFGVRFEDNAVADIQFVAGSDHCAVWGGYTAGSRQAVKDLQVAESPHLDSSDLGMVSVEESDARPKVSSGRHVFGAAGKAPEVHPDRDYAACFQNYVLMGPGAAVEFSDGDAGRIVGMAAAASGELTISGYNRATRQYDTVNLGGGSAVRPLRHGTTDLGSGSHAYRSLHLAQGLYVGGKRMLPGRQPAIADDRSVAANSRTVNQILAALRRLGLVEE